MKNSSSKRQTIDIINKRRLFQLDEIIDEEKSYEETATKKFTSSMGKHDLEFQKTNPDDLEFTKSLNKVTDEEFKRNNTAILD